MNYFMKSRLFVMLLAPLVLFGAAGCSSVGAFDEGEEAEAASEAPRRANLPSYTASEVTRGRLEGIVFGDTEWAVPPGEKAKVQAVATYLKVRAERVIVAGGAQVTSAEYARQLGQQRALAVRDALIKEGIPANRIVTVSYGLDLPGKGGDRVEFGVVPTGEKAF
jgi:outer membrane protein OmpA-like peptidoglycan-associated protein